MSWVSIAVNLLLHKRVDASPLSLFFVKEHKLDQCMIHWHDSWFIGNFTQSTLPLVLVSLYSALHLFFHKSETRTLTSSWSNLLLSLSIFTSRWWLILLYFVGGTIDLQLQVATKMPLRFSLAVAICNRTQSMKSLWSWYEVCTKYEASQSEHNTTLTTINLLYMYSSIIIAVTNKCLFVQQIHPSLSNEEVKSTHWITVNYSLLMTCQLFFFSTFVLMRKSNLVVFRIIHMF